MMKSYKLKTYKVDGETRVGIWINDNFVEEVDCYSDFKPKEAKEYLKSKHITNG